MSKKDFYCPLYNGNITQSDCDALCMGVNYNHLRKDSKPLMTIEEITEKQTICIRCQIKTNKSFSSNPEIIKRVEELERMYRDDEGALEVIERGKITFTYLEEKAREGNYDGQTPEEYLMSLEGHLLDWHITTKDECQQDCDVEKHSWREKYTPEYTYDLNPLGFETENDLLMAIAEKLKQKYEQEEKEIKSQTPRKQNTAKELSDDKIYTFLGVIFSFANYHYYYLTDDDTISIGDYVLVPVGFDDKESIGKVVSVEKHLRMSAPFPVGKTKRIIRKCTELIDTKEK